MQCQNMSYATQSGAKLSRVAVRWALTGLVIHHLTLARDRGSGRVLEYH